MYINCYQLCRQSILSLEFVDLFYNQIKWDVISRYTLLDEAILYKYHNKLNWRYISLYQNLSLSFILYNYDWLHEKKLKHNKNFSKKFIQDIILKRKGDKFMFKLINSNKRYKKLKYLYS
jgi:DNA modification methylase|tara:strand:- start:1044 stop:1403 length:360 start_codon:yes stop_codon:yes gene_type:complete